MKSITRRKLTRITLPILLVLALLPGAGALAAKADTSGLIGIDAAVSAALEDAGAASEDVTFTKWELDFAGGAYEYEIEFIWDGTIYKYDIDGTTAAVNGFSKSLWAENKRFETAGLIGFKKAKEAALSHAGVDADQVRFEKLELDKDDGVMEYEIEFTTADGTEYEYEIHAYTGELLSYDMESPERR